MISTLVKAASESPYPTAHRLMFCTLHLNRVAYKKKSLIIDQVYFYYVSTGGVRAGIFASAEHKAFQVTPVPEDSQSMSALLVCAVMPHLEYKHDSCLKRKAQLVCLLAHSVSFLALTFLPRVKIFFSSFLSSSLELSVVCSIDVFVPFPLMVHHFGCFVNTHAVHTCR